MRANTIFAHAEVPSSSGLQTIVNELNLRLEIIVVRQNPSTTRETDVIQVKCTRIWLHRVIIASTMVRIVAAAKVAIRNEVLVDPECNAPWERQQQLR